MSILLCCETRAEAAAWRDALQNAGVTDISIDRPANPGAITYAIWGGALPGVLHGLSNLRAALSLWAGVEEILRDLPASTPVIRMLDPGLTAGMREYVVGHVLRHHLGMDAQARAMADRRWAATVPPLAARRRVGVLGLGVLGQAAAHALSALGFPVAGWRRRAAPVDGIRTHSGPDGLRDLLARSDILACLLPQTTETDGLLDAAALARLPRGARVINAGRGGAIVDDALLDALDSGHLGGATLDVFREEPLPPAHRFWTHPKVLVTPHVASATRPETAAPVLARTLQRLMAGAAPESLPGYVDRARGY